MKAFLSHSSRDKDFVDAVVDVLRPGTFEVDSLTFDAGLINSAAIIESLNRCDLFCLFLSEASVSSSYVDFETLIGVELIASGRINRFLAICLDDKAFGLASENIRFFNILRKSLEPESVARLIQGHLISSSQLRGQQSHPFLGREGEIVELEKQVNDHSRPVSRALYISGNAGSGRRTIAQKFYEAQYPNVSRVLPTLSLEQFSGMEELYRRTLATLRPSMPASELRTRVYSFDSAPSKERPQIISKLFNSLLPANEAIYLVDNGGVLTDAGALTPEINDVISELETRPHPPAIIIAPRMIPRRLRRKEDDLSYLAVKALDWETSTRLMAKLTHDRSMKVTQDELDDLVKLSDGHPFNFYRIADEVSDRGVGPFLASPTDFIEWKHRNSSEYLKSVSLSVDESTILALFQTLPMLDFASIISALPIEEAAASEALLRLGDLHIVEAAADQFTIAPALRVAVERDRRIQLEPGIQKEAARILARSLAVRLEEGTAPISLVDAAVLASLEAGDILSGFTAAFLLPSHHVWMAKRHYDLKHWDDSIRASKEALRGGQRLSLGGRVAACRYLCLASARIGEESVFDEGIAELEKIASDDWVKSNVYFLKGFNQRLKGNLPRAEDLLKSSYRLSPGNNSAARELAAICLARGRLDEAEHFAREAQGYTTSNPYIVDILIAVLIRKHGSDPRYMSEIDNLFDALERDDRESGRSFFTTRRAEFEHLWGDNREARKLIDQAMRRTPRIFEPRRLFVSILLKEGNNTLAFEQINLMMEIVNARHPNERRSNYRSFLETNAEYLTAVGRYQEAKDIFTDPEIFEEEERARAIRDIEIVQAYKSR